MMDLPSPDQMKQELLAFENERDALFDQLRYFQDRARYNLAQVELYRDQLAVVSAQQEAAVNGALMILIETMTKQAEDK